MQDKRFVLGVDLDGVVADFYDGLRPIAAEWAGQHEQELDTNISYGLKEWQLDSYGQYEDLHRFAVTQRDLFRKLKPISGAPAVLRRLSTDNIRIRIITHRLFIKYFHKEAVLQTTEWLESHGIPYWDLCFMKDKEDVGADLYIEDSPENIQALRDEGHEAIVFVNSTNEHMVGPRARDWIEVESMVQDAKRRWEAAL